MARIVVFSTLIAVLTLGLSPAFAAADSPRVPLKGIEGPNVRARVQARGIEGPDIRLAGKSVPKGVEGPDVR